MPVWGVGVVSRGAFITLEGGEGCGKSGAAARLVTDLNAAGIVAVGTREPGGSHIGDRIRAVLLNMDGRPLNPRTEALLMAAERAEHVATVVEPALAAGVTVVSDRFLDSSVAYQGVARGLGAQHIHDLSVWAAAGLIPDLTVFLDVEPEIGLARRMGAGEVNRMDMEGLEFHRRAREGFLWAAQQDAARFRVVGAARDADAVYADVWATVLDFLQGHAVEVAS